MIKFSFITSIVSYDFSKIASFQISRFSFINDILLSLILTNLHKNYVSCYVKKEQELRLFPSQYRSHMFKLHEHFINDLRPIRLCITNTEVIKYVNGLHPSL